MIRELAPSCDLDHRVQSGYGGDERAIGAGISLSVWKDSREGLAGHLGDMPPDKRLEHARQAPARAQASRRQDEQVEVVLNPAGAEIDLGAALAALRGEPRMLTEE